jgi:DNA-binding GntR family transcriptional regulator
MHATLENLRAAPTLIEQAYDAILAAICDGRLAPAARLNQDLLAARLGISRQPVGQALTILRAQGFVRDTGRRGLIVAPLDPQFFRAIYELREALDSLAATLAAQRCTPADAAVGRKLVAEGRVAARRGRVAELIEAHMGFHMWICGVAGNPLLSETMRLYWNHLRRAMGEVLRDAAVRRRLWDEHQQLLRAIVSRDPAAAARRAVGHAREAGKTLARTLPAAPPPDRGALLVLPQTKGGGSQGRTRP